MTTLRLNERLGALTWPRRLPNLRLPNWRPAIRRVALIGALGVYASVAIAVGVIVTALLLTLSASPSSPATAEASQMQAIRSSASQVSYLAQEQADEATIYALRYQEPPAAAPAPAAAPPPAAPVQSGSAEDGTYVGQHITAGQVSGVNITFYDCLDQGFCGTMYDGHRVYQGAAACSWNLPLGTQFKIQGDPTGRIYSCADRGLLSNTWVDIFWYDPADGWAWQHVVGRYGTIVIVR